MEYADSTSDESEIAEIAEEMSVQDFSIARGLTFKDLFPADTYNTTCKEPTDDDMETVSEKSVLPTYLPSILTKIDLRHKLMLTISLLNIFHFSTEGG